jgi:hypothetical protein
MPTPPPAPHRRTKADVLNRDFLEVRCKILELAAALDRLDRAGRSGVEAPDSRVTQLRQALEALLDPEPCRAETVQHIFSLEYDPDWREQFGLTSGKADGRGPAARGR